MKKVLYLGLVTAMAFLYVATCSQAFPLKETTTVNGPYKVIARIYDFGDPDEFLTYILILEHKESADSDWAMQEYLVKAKLDSGGWHIKSGKGCTGSNLYPPHTFNIDEQQAETVWSIVEFLAGWAEWRDSKGK